MKPKQRPTDPLGIVGKEVRAADGGNDGCLVRSYDNLSGDYTVQSIAWDSGRLDGFCAVVNECMIVRLYDVEQPRVRTAEKR